MHTYEIFTEEFSRIVQACNMLDALVLFYIDHPRLEVIKITKISCDRSCGPGDYRKGGKCDTNGCF